MRRRRNNPPNITNDDASLRGRVRVTEIHYHSPTSGPPPIPLHLYTHASWRTCVFLFVTVGAVGKFLSTSVSSSSQSLSATSITPQLIDVPFCVAAVAAGLSLVYWILLPFPAHWMWPDPHLPMEQYFIVRAQHNLTFRTRCTGLLVLGFGVAGMLWSAWSLGTSWSPMSSPIWDTTTANGGGLVIQGSYAYVRHPMYLSNFIIAAGLGCVSGNRILGCSWVLLACTLLLRVPSEELQLQRNVGTTEEAETQALFREWMETTGMIFPRIW